MQDEVIATPTPNKRVRWNKGKLTGAKPPPSSGAGFCSSSASSGAPSSQQSM